MVPIPTFRKKKNAQFAVHAKQYHYQTSTHSFQPETTTLLQSAHLPSVHLQRYRTACFQMSLAGVISFPSFVCCVNFHTLGRRARAHERPSVVRRYSPFPKELPTYNYCGPYRLNQNFRANNVPHCLHRNASMLPY